MSRLYVKLEVSYHQDPKVLDLDDERAELLYVRALTYCKQHLTDGVIHRRAIASFAPFSDQVAPTVLADELVRVGLWVDHERGWMVAAWLDHNKASDDILTPKRGAELAHIRHHVNKGITKSGCQFCEDEESEKPQVNAHVCGPHCGAQCGGALPETETETETETTTTTPVDNSTTPAPAPTVVVEIDEQKIRRTAVAVGTAVAAEADASNPAAYAAQVTRRILRGDDPTDRDQIRARLEAGDTPEQIAADWRTSDPAAASDSLTGAIGRHPAATEARNPLTVPRSTDPGCATCEGMGQFFDPADDVARPCPECRPDPIPNIRLVETS